MVWIRQGLRFFLFYFRVMDDQFTFHNRVVVVDNYYSQIYCTVIITNSSAKLLILAMITCRLIQLHVHV